MDRSSRNGDEYGSYGSHGSYWYDGPYWGTINSHRPYRLDWLYRTSRNGDQYGRHRSRGSHRPYWTHWTRRIRHEYRINREYGPYWFHGSHGK